MSSAAPVTLPSAWVDGGRWSGLVASRRGSAHAPGVPNQDAALLRALPDGGFAAAVADGHGGSRHPRSDVGARLAVQLALDTIAASPGTDLRHLMPRVVIRWRDAVSEHVRQHPLDERGRHDPLAAYGSTLLVALVLGDTLQLAQLGDGDVVVGTPAGPVRPVPADARLVADETTSLCLPTALADVRFAELPLSGPTAATLVVLASDGLGKSHADPGWWALLVEDYEHLLHHRGPGYLADELPGWIADSALVAGDDTTVAVLRRSDPAQERTRP